MARMIPEKPQPESSQGERRVFEILERELSGEWTAIHSQRVILPEPGDRYATEREIDFVVVAPDARVLCLEVKGGTIDVEEGQWTSTNSSGRHPIRDPGKQAQTAARVLDRFLSSQAGGNRVRCGWAAVFPDCVAPSRVGPALPRQVIIDATDLRSPGESLSRALDFSGLPATQDPMALVDLVVNSLAPSQQMVRSLAAAIDTAEPILLRLTEQQQATVLSFGRNIQRASIRGSAGTGKTVVAMERCRRLAQKGRKALLLCFNRKLAEALAPTAHGFDVDSFHRFSRRLIIEAGLAWEPPSAKKDPKAAERFWAETVPELLLQALAELPEERWDDVVVDEAQDFRDNWWIAVSDLLKSDTNGTLWVFHDPDQNVYGGNLAETLDLTGTFELDINCRNTQNIAAFCSSLVRTGTQSLPDAPNGAPVEQTSAGSDEEMIDSTQKALHDFLAVQKLAPSDVIVLSLRGTDSAVWKRRRLGNYTLTRYPSELAANGVHFDSVRPFKGLERDAVIIVDVPTDMSDEERCRLYVGSSRARHALHVLYAPAENRAR